MNSIAAFHFLRPAWLFCFVPLAGLLWLMWRRQLSSRSWQSVVDAPLLRHLLIGENKKRNPWSWRAIALGGTLAILAMAGPAWRKFDVPVFRQQSALVLLLDMSRSMDAQDIKPSRLERAKLKLTDILRRQKEGQTALVVFAADAFVVSPLTSDANTIISQLQSFSTDLMPAQGSRPDLAVSKAEQLLKQAGSAHGGMLLITDGVDDADRSALDKAASRLHDAGYRLSVMGVGTAQGAPIPTPGGGFLKSAGGAIVLPRLDAGALREIATEGGGQYRALSASDDDIDALLSSLQSAIGQQHTTEIGGMKSDQWRDEGPWLLLPVLLLGALAFRRGVWVALLLVALQPVRPVQAMDWNSLWRNADQRGQQALQARQPQQAAQLFRDPNWRAAAEYKAGNYQAAAADLKDAKTADALYNRANALAHTGQLQQAIADYDAALKMNPKLADAAYNRDLVKKMLQQQNNNSSQASDKSSASKDQKPSQQGKDSASQAQNKSSSDANQQDGKNQNNSSNGSSENNRENSSKDQPKPENGSNGNQQNNAQDRQQNQQQNPQAQGKTEQGKADQDKPNQTKSDQGSAGDKENQQASAESMQQDAREKAQADRQWLQRIPDDPGGLWRNKFLYQYKQQGERSEKQPW
jgi:Ca-activated chloride channel family protein